MLLAVERRKLSALMYFVFLQQGGGMQEQKIKKAKQTQFLKHILIIFK